MIRHTMIACAAALFAGASALAQSAQLKLETAHCANVGQDMLVEVRIAPNSPLCVGMQGALSYDKNVLTFVGEEPGDAPFDLPIYFAHNGAEGKIDLAVGISPPNPPSSGNVVVKRLRFHVANAPATCLVGNLVQFRRDKKVRNLLTNSNGDPILPALVSLNTVNLGDAPVLTLPPDVVITPPLGEFSATASLGVVTVSGCGPGLSLSFTRSDGRTTINAPFAQVNAPIDIVWTATDECGRTDTGTQRVTFATLFCDVDRDGIVNGGDLTFVLSGFGSTGPESDLNSDGIVDGADIAFILNAWGSSN